MYVCMYDLLMFIFMCMFMFMYIYICIAICHTPFIVCKHIPKHLLRQLSLSSEARKRLDHDFFRWPIFDKKKVVSMYVNVGEITMYVNVC